MQCLNCGGQLEWAGGGQHARCMRCLSLFSNETGQLTPVVVQAPGGGFNPEFNNIFAQNLGFGPPPPGAQPMPPPQMGGMGMGPPGGYGGPPPPNPNHNVGAGTFDLGGGQQLRIKINGKSPENFVKGEISSMIWGWIIGGIILALVVLTFVGIGVYTYVVAKDPTAGGGHGVATGTSWDGKSTLDCKGNDKISLVGVTATAGIKASANCQIEMTGCNITAPIGIDASGNAKVSMTGGTITSTTNSVVASGGAKVDLVGTKVTGKAKVSGGAKVTGAPL